MPETHHCVRGDNVGLLTRVGYTNTMQILYNDKTDLLYIRLDDRKQQVVNRRVTDDVVLDMGEGDRIIGIEILDASKHLNLERLLPVKYRGPRDTL
jgi:uncharacterized protein YuzE